MQQGGRPSGPPHGAPSHPPIQWAPPKLWTMQTPKLPTEEPFIPDLHAPDGTDQEDKLPAELIEHGYRDPPFVRPLFLLYLWPLHLIYAQIVPYASNEDEEMTFLLSSSSFPPFFPLLLAFPLLFLFYLLSWTITSSFDPQPMLFIKTEGAKTNLFVASSFLVARLRIYAA